MHSNAYAEQDGVKRHTGPMIAVMSLDNVS
jgi:hypothetical protein